MLNPTFPSSGSSSGGSDPAIAGRVAALETDVTALQDFGSTVQTPAAQARAHSDLSIDDESPLEWFGVATGDDFVVETGGVTYTHVHTLNGGRGTLKSFLENVPGIAAIDVPFVPGDETYFYLDIVSNSPFRIRGNMLGNLFFSPGLYEPKPASTNDYIGDATAVRYGSGSVGQRAAVWDRGDVYASSVIRSQGTDFMDPASLNIGEWRGSKVVEMTNVLADLGVTGDGGMISFVIMRNRDGSDGGSEVQVEYIPSMTIQAFLDAIKTAFATEAPDVPLLYCGLRNGRLSIQIDAISWIINPSFSWLDGFPDAVGWVSSFDTISDVTTTSLVLKPAIDRIKSLEAQLAALTATVEALRSTP